MKMNLIVVLTLALAFFAAGCGKSDKTETTGIKSNETGTEEPKDDKKTLEVSATDKAIEIHTSGMTCTGCEKTIKAKVKKVDGVKDVIADFKSNTVKASYDPGKTNPDAIKEAITSAGYKVEQIH